MRNKLVQNRNIATIKQVNKIDFILLIDYARQIQLNQLAISQINSLVNNTSLKKLINAK